LIYKENDKIDLDLKQLWVFILSVYFNIDLWEAITLFESQFIFFFRRRDKGDGRTGANNIKHFCASICKYLPVNIKSFRKVLQGTNAMVSPLVLQMIFKHRQSLVEFSETGRNKWPFSKKPN